MASVYLTNPGALLIAGNPGKAKKPRKNKGKGKSMATKKKRRSKAQIAATRKMLAARRKSLKGARSNPKLGKVARKAKRSRRGKRSGAAKMARKARKARRRAKVSVTEKTITTRVNPRRRRRRKMKARKSGKRRTVRARRNPSDKALGFLEGFTGFGKNWDDLTKGGLMGWAAAAGGGIAAVFGGTLINRVTTPFVANVAPTLAANPVFARVFSAFNAYLGGYLLARFVPASKGTKRAMLMGGTVAAVVELVKPGLVMDVTGRIPVIGPLFSGAIAKVEGLGEYVRLSLAGMGEYASVNQNAGRMFNRRSERLAPGNRIQGLRGPAYNAVTGRKISLQGQGSSNPSNAYGPNVVDQDYNRDNGLGCSFADQVVTVASDDGTMQ